VAGRIEGVIPVQQIVEETIAEFHETIAALATQYT